MERERLAAYLSEGLSLPQIGELTGRHPSTVGYWVTKYGLVANGKEKYAPRGGLTPAELEPLIEQGMTLEKIASELDRSVPTIRFWLERHELKKPIEVRRQRVTEAIAAGVDILELQCAAHGRTDHVLESRGYYRCKRCRLERVSEWRRRVKRKLIEEFGGCCQLCGYDRCPAALQFHHLDPSLKQFSISRQGITRSYAELRAEAEKCILLCANCHAEVEVGFREIDEVAQLVLHV